VTGAVSLPALGCLLVFAAGLALQIAFAARGRKSRLEKRFRAALDRHERVNFIDLSAPPADLSSETAVGAHSSRVARLFGFDRERLDLYPVDPRVAIAGALVIALLVASVTTLLLGRVGLLAALPLWPVASRMLFGRWQRQRASTLFKQFPDALAMIVRGVRVGIPVGEAIRAVTRSNPAPTSGEFARVADQTAIGMPLDDALRTMAERTGLPEYRFFATALSLQSQTGGNLSETLEGLADVIRKRVAARDRGFALAAEARTSANVLAALPVLLFIALWFMNPAYVMTLLVGSSGHLILGATILLLCAGMGVMKMLIRASLS
jgi:tight adherence protein B